MRGSLAVGAAAAPARLAPCSGSIHSTSGPSWSTEREGFPQPALGHTSPSYNYSYRLASIRGETEAQQSKRLAWGPLAKVGKEINIQPVLQPLLHCPPGLPGDIVAHGSPERHNSHAQSHGRGHQRVVAFPVVRRDKEGIDAHS